METAMRSSSTVARPRGGEIGQPTRKWHLAGRSTSHPIKMATARLIRAAVAQSPEAGKIAERRARMDALRRQLNANGISLMHVARLAGVSISNVSAVFGGRRVSANIVTTAERLLAKAGRRRARKEDASDR
jgi:hypothetical protein